MRRTTLDIPIYKQQKTKTKQNKITQKKTIKKIKSVRPLPAWNDFQNHMQQVMALNRSPTYFFFSLKLAECILHLFLLHVLLVQYIIICNQFQRCSLHNYLNFFFFFFFFFLHLRKSERGQ